MAIVFVQMLAFNKRAITIIKINQIETFQRHKKPKRIL